MDEPWSEGDESDSDDYEMLPMPSDAEWTGVSFDISEAAHAYWPRDSRVMLGCVNRCFCNVGVDDLTLQPKRGVPSRADVKMIKSEDTYELKLDVTGDWDTWNYEGLQGDTLAEAVPSLEMIEPNKQFGYALLPIHLASATTLSLDRGNYITCQGNLPAFPLPEPYLVSEFQNPTQLYAVEWSGGLS